MTKLVVSNTFLRKRSMLWSDRIGENVDGMLRTIEQMPGVGSSLVPESIASEFGPQVLKAVVSPYEIIYEYCLDEDVVYVYDLLYGPNVH